MKYYQYKGETYNIRELSDLSGVNYTTICERLKRGYTVEEALSDGYKIPESVEEFFHASHPPDWDRMTTDHLFDIYATWCRRHDYEVESKVHFVRSIKRCVPLLKVIPSRVRTSDGVKYCRIIRV